MNTTKSADDNLDDSSKKHSRALEKINELPDRILKVYTKLNLFKILMHNVSYTENMYYKQLKSCKRVITTTCLSALSGAQEFYDIVYVDDVEIYPNNKITNKDIRYGHNLFKLEHSWYMQDMIAYDWLNNKTIANAIKTSSKAKLKLLLLNDNQIGYIDIIDDFILGEIL